MKNWAKRDGHHRFKQALAEIEPVAEPVSDLVRVLYIEMCSTNAIKLAVRSWRDHGRAAGVQVFAQP
jgi:hypothetical protein